jgi:NhaP-type Na+/H+ or K+/H+ antiporter
MSTSEFAILFVVVGALFVLMALSGSVLRRLPLSTAIVYLAFGFALGPRGLDIVKFNLLTGVKTVEHITEIAVIVSLFSAGLKLRVPIHDALWRVPLRLAFLSMVVTVGLVAVVGWMGLGLSMGAAIILGAVIAPTDPVLASDVQVTNAQDVDQLRFSLTGEAGLNDGTAFPFVMLGLGLVGVHELGAVGMRWVAVDVVWAMVAGLAIGAACGTAIGRLVLYLRRTHREATGLDDFLALGLIAISYGAALLVHAYGFLAVFAAGLALSRLVRVEPGDTSTQDLEAPPSKADDLAIGPETAPAYMVQSLLGFNEQLERIAEVGVVVLVGVLLSTGTFTGDVWWFVPLLFLILRPLAVAIGLYGTTMLPAHRVLISWFGIRGIGSLYYLAFAISHGLGDEDASKISTIVLGTIALSVVVHGVSVTPLMNRYQQRYE